MARSQLLERDDLIGDLEARLEEARSGSGSLVLIAGEAGSGKTAMTRAFIADAGQRALTLVGACDPLSTPRPLSPLFDFAADEESGLSGLFVDDPDNIEIFNRVLDRIRHTIRPIIMIVEDVHWADQATFDFLRFVGRRISDSKAVVLCTYRNDEIGPDHSLQALLGQLSVVESTHRIEVRPLTPQAVARLTAGTDVDAHEIYRITGGNPFYVTEIIAGGERLPASVQDAVMARVSHLERRSVQVVRAVSIAPRSLSVEHAMHLTGASPEEIDRTVSSGVLIGEGENLRFRHELARAAVEESIPPGTRHALHSEMIALLLEDDHRDHARIAHHAIAAEAPDLVVEYAPRAAEEAAGRGGHKEAVEFYEAALSHLPREGGPEEAGLRLRLAVELGIVDRQADGVEQSEKAVAYLRESGDEIVLANALVTLSNARWRDTDTVGGQKAMTEALAILEPKGPSRDLAYALYTAGYRYMLARRAGAALEPLERARRMANDVGASDLLWGIDMMLGTIEIVMGKPRQAATALRQSAEEAMLAGDRTGVSTALGMLGSGGGEARVYEEALPALKEAIDWGLANDQDYGVAYNRAWLARIAFEQGRWDDSVSIANLVDETSLYREGIAIVTALGAKGRALVRRGDPLGHAILQRVTGLGKRHELQHVWSPICGLAESHWLRGNSEAMEATLQDAYRRALDTDSEWARGEVGFWMWKAGAIDGPPDNAASPFALHMSGEFEAAAEAWRTIGCPYEVGLALLDGKADAVVEAVSTFDSLGARPAADMARARLREMGVEKIPRGPTAETRNNPAGLTGRQLEVLELMTTGLSNAEIAEALFVSKKTVEHHVSAIYTKLGVESRAQAMAEAGNLGIGGSSQK